MANSAITIAENNEVKIPMMSVVAKDSISPVPNTFKMIATKRCVTLASMIEGRALRKPVLIAVSVSAPDACSSRTRSKMRMLASTAVPIVRTIPAIPAKVSTAPKEAREPKMKMTFAVRAIFAAKPALP